MTDEQTAVVKLQDLLMLQEVAHAYVTLSKEVKKLTEGCDQLAEGSRQLVKSHSEWKARALTAEAALGMPDGYVPVKQQDLLDLQESPKEIARTAFEGLEQLGKNALEWKEYAEQLEAKLMALGEGLGQHTQRIVEAVTKPRKIVLNKEGDPIGNVVVDSLGQ